MNKTSLDRVEIYKKDNAQVYLSFGPYTTVHFFSRQNQPDGSHRELSIYENSEGYFIFSIASGHDEFYDEEHATLHQAYAALIRNLNVPL